MNIQSSFTVYTAALHSLILILFSLHTSGLGYPGLTWIDCISSKQKLFISKNKQQETLHQQQAAGETNHSAENNINLSGSRGSLSLRTGSNPAPYI